MRRLTILVGGRIAAIPFQGGWTWAILQYLLGLKRLGHDVYFVELLDREALAPEMALADSVNAAYFQHVVTEFGLQQNSALVLRDTHESVGLPYTELQTIAGRAAVLLNVSGVFMDEALAENIPLRLYLDLDPGYTQLWQTSQHIDMDFAGSTHFITVGLAVGEPGCEVPTCGFRWIPTLPPVILNHWPAANAIVHDGLTTVANWRSYGSIEHDGVFYGQKAHSLREFVTLPKATSEKFILALSIHEDERKDLAALESNGWEILDPGRVAATPSLYKQFVAGSKAEFGIAKSGYVASNCGWFSDRSVCYLASGRPVIAQDTGFSRFLPTGEGLFAFKTEEDVLTALEALRSDYSRHSRAARDLAVQYFDSDKVLSGLLEKVESTTCARES